MVLSSFFSIILCLKSPCRPNILDQSHPRLIIVWAIVTPSLGSQTPHIFNFITSVGSKDLEFPKLPYLKVQEN